MWETLRFRCAGWLGRRRALFYAVNRARGRPGLVDARTDITIEGFPRSGNTFAVRAFLLANPSASVASHWHAPAQLHESVRRGFPSIVVVREPAAAASSLLVRRPDLPAAAVVRSYLEFHQAILPLANDVVIAPFEEVTTDFGRTIARVNQRFRGSFTLFRHDRQNVEAVFAAMDAFNKAAFGGSISARHVPRPDPAREALSRQVRFEALHRELAAAGDLHRALLAQARK